MCMYIYIIILLYIYHVHAYVPRCVHTYVSIEACRFDQVCRHDVLFPAIGHSSCCTVWVSNHLTISMSINQ